MNEQHAQQIAARVVSLSRTAGLTLSGAESCTGGLIAKLLTDIPGSSSVFFGACVTYTNAVKEKLLGVDPAIIEAHTEVSYACAEAMAEGARCKIGTDLAYSTTGYAGPGGGTEVDPVGTVYLAISCKHGTHSHRISLPTTASREEIRLAAAICVLEKLEAEIYDLTEAST